MGPGYDSTWAKSLLTTNFYDPSYLLKENAMQNIFSHFLREHFEKFLAVFRKKLFLRILVVQ